MNDQLIKAKMSIPTTEELQHDLQGSDQFSALNCRDSIFHFRLDKKSQELFKFQGHNGVYRFLALVMKTRRHPKNATPPMSKILNGLKGMLVFKDDILVQYKGD